MLSLNKLISFDVKSTFSQLNFMPTFSVVTFKITHGCKIANTRVKTHKLL